MAKKEKKTVEKKQPDKKSTPEKKEPAKKGTPEKKDNSKSGTGKKDPDKSSGSGKKSPAKTDGSGKKAPAKTVKKDPDKSSGPGKKSPAKTDGSGKKIPAKGTGTGKQNPAKGTGTGKQNPAKGTGTGKQTPVKGVGAGKQNPAKGGTVPAKTVNDPAVAKRVEKELKTITEATKNLETIKWKKYGVIGGGMASVLAANLTVLAGVLSGPTVSGPVAASFLLTTKVGAIYNTVSHLSSLSSWGDTEMQRLRDANAMLESLKKSHPEYFKKK